MDVIELIDKYIDRQLPVEQAQQLEADLQKDADLMRLFDSMIMARAAIQSSALNARIKRLHAVYLEELEAESQQDDVVIPMYRRPSFTWALRIAASLLLGVTAYSSYEVTKLNPEQYSDAKFIPYQLPVTRGTAESGTSLDLLYRSGRYAAVTQRFANLATKEPRDYFLTAIAHLQRNEPNEAINLLKALRQYNAQQAKPLFAQESDYYLALAYLGANRLEDAYALFKTIHDTPQHLYAETITDGDLLTLKVLMAKQ